MNLSRKLSDGLFLEISKRVAKRYPEIEHNEMIIDNTCMQLVSNPHQFDVMITTNLYGTIVSNVICGLVGGAGLLSGRNYGDHVCSVYLSYVLIKFLDAVTSYSYCFSMQCSNLELGIPVHLLRVKILLIR